MYMELYGLREQPFGVTPNPRFLYFSALHKNALASLVNSVCERRGFSALIAKPGMGKTTLIMQLLSLLRDSARTGFLFQTHGSTQEFLSALLQDIDAPPASYDLVDMQKALNAAVLREARANRQLVIVVDEAQNLSDETLESIRLLSNFENPEAKLLHIVLAGQPPLADKLAAPQLAQLRQRLSVVTHLSPFTREQVAEYIERRMQVAGRTTETSLFTPDALEFIAQASEGIPRNINNLCFHALSVGYASRKPSLDLATVQFAARALDLKGGSASYARRLAPAPVVPPTTQTPARPAAEEWARTWQRVDSFSPAAPAKARQKKWFKVKAGIGAFAGIALFVGLLRAGVLPPQMLAYFYHPSSEISSSPSQTKPSSTLPSLAGLAPATPVSDPDTAGSPVTPSSLLAAHKTESDAAASAAMPAAAPPSVAENARLVRTKTKEDVEQLTRRYFGAHTGDVLPVVLQLNPGIATPPVALPAGTAVMIPTESSDTARNKHTRHARGSASDKTAARSSGSKRNSTQIAEHVQVRHTENIFEFAMEHCGKADREIVEQIRAANPQIHDIYQTLEKGQLLVIPAGSGSGH